jgi:SnoaL-like domain
MLTLQQLSDLEEIKKLKYRSQLDLLEACFTEDARIWLANGKYARTGIAAIMDFYRDLLMPAPSFISTHMVGHPEITFTGETTATGIWRVEDIVHFTEANPMILGFEAKRGEILQGAANYYDEYVRRDGSWKILSTGYVRIFEQVLSAGGLPGFRLMVDPDLGVKRGW